MTRLSATRLAVSLLVPSLALAACGDDRAPPQGTPGRDGHGASRAGTAAGHGGTAAPSQAAGALATTHHAAFGLRLPDGMTPAGSPSPGVFRFEGHMAPPLVASFLEAQLAPFDPPAAEPGGTLYRRVTVRSPAGGVQAIPLAIRLHDVDSGTAVDVWSEEEKPRAKEAAAAPTPALGAGSSDAALGADAKRSTAPKYATPEERRRAVFEMMQKVSRGEKLTPEDMDNPLFQ